MVLIVHPVMIFSQRLEDLALISEKWAAVGRCFVDMMLYLLQPYPEEDLILQYQTIPFIVKCARSSRANPFLSSQKRRNRPTGT